MKARQSQQQELSPIDALAVFRRESHQPLARSSVPHRSLTPTLI
jgi:hypothetical protein